MENELKIEEVWEEDLDPDAEPSMDLQSATDTFTCGFCERLLLSEAQLLSHASTEHDIGPEAFAGINLRDSVAVQEVFLKAANLRREFVSLGEVDRCPKCKLLFASAALLASHRCSTQAEPNPEPTHLSVALGPNKARDPLLVAQVDQEEAKLQWKKMRNLKISETLNSLAGPILVNRIVKPLVKPQVKLTVGNIIEMSLVETITQAGLKVMVPEEYHEENAVETIYQLCRVSQRQLSVSLRSLLPPICQQLLHLLRSRRVRVHATTTELPTPMVGHNLVRSLVSKIAQPAKQVNSRLRTILPAPSVDGSHLTLMESLLKEASAPKLSSKPKPVQQHFTVKPKVAPKVFIDRVRPYNRTERLVLPKGVPVIAPLPVQPPPQQIRKKLENYKCDDCSRTFETDYQMLKHMQWKSFDQKRPEPLFCRFCPDGDRYFAYCEKGFKNHVSVTHGSVDEGASLCLNAYILSSYSCPHCTKRHIKKNFCSVLLLTRHLSTCCRREKCTVCPPEIKMNQKPVKRRKSSSVLEGSPKKKQKHEKKTKKVKLTPIESVFVGDFSESKPDVQSLPVTQEPVIAELPQIPQPPVVIKQERIEAEVKSYECAVCERKMCQPYELRVHFEHFHPTLCDEFQACITKCGSLSLRWMCPMCARIFYNEKDLLHHFQLHKIKSTDVLERTTDLGHLPSLRTILLDLKKLAK